MRVSKPGLLLAVIGLLDNITTVTAISRGAYELNPLVNIFLSSYELYTLFTIVKCAILYIVASKLNLRNKLDMIIYIVLVVIFVRAIIINVINSLGV
jgi:hypothetical protein